MDTSKTLWHGCRSCRYLTLRRGVFGFVHHSIAILYHQVPNPNITIRNFFIAVPPRVARRARLHGRLPMRGSLRAAHHDVSVLTAAWLCAGDLPRGVDSSSAAAACSSINSISQSYVLSVVACGFIAATSSTALSAQKKTTCRVGKAGEGLQR